MIEQDILWGLQALGLQGESIIVHSSLKSFGTVAGGAPTIVQALINSCKTVLMPAFIADSHTRPPLGDRPVQNGCDYSFYNTWKGRQGPFDLATATINPKMGVIALTLARRHDTRRSNHPWHSWSASGIEADSLVEGHSWGSTNRPLERHSSNGGRVLLMGVGLSSCTAIHLAEERAGRRPFIRWAIGNDGTVHRIRVSGCAKGFNRLYPRLRDCFIEATVGASRWLAAPLETLIARATEVIRGEPELTRCSDSCLRCHDAILGGPL